MRLAGTFYRGHDPKWAWSPLSGEGAAIHGGKLCGFLTNNLGNPVDLRINPFIDILR